jgi:hypothetical protein
MRCRTSITQPGRRASRRSHLARERLPDLPFLAQSTANDRSQPSPDFDLASLHATGGGPGGERAPLAALDRPRPHRRVVGGQCPVFSEPLLATGGQIRQGILQPGGASTDVTLASNRYLAIALNWTEAGPRDQVSDVRLILQIDRFLVCSLLGCTAFSYEGIGDRPVGRTETGAWWRAWQPFLFTAIALGHALYLIIAWWLLTIVYAWAIRLLAFYLDRDLDFTGATRVAQAALIPGALWLTATVFLHAAGWLDLLSVLVVLVMHVPVGWLYAGLACRSLPLRPDVLPPNPFQSAEPSGEPRSENPFSAKDE